CSSKIGCTASRDSTTRSRRVDRQARHVHPRGYMRAASSEAKTVLIADDDVWMREMLTLLLMDEGYRLLEAGTGRETVEVARERQPDIILLDVCMPGRSGLRVLADLRQQTSTRDIPVLLMSGAINL